MSVTSCCLSGGQNGGQPLLAPPLFQQLWSKHGKTHSKTGYCIQQSRPKKYSVNQTTNLKSPNMGLTSIYENYRTINLKNILGRQPRIH